MEHPRQGADGNAAVCNNSARPLAVLALHSRPPCQFVTIAWLPVALAHSRCYTLNESMIELENLGRKFGSTHAVEDLSRAIPRGSTLGLLGMNEPTKSADYIAWAQGARLQRFSEFIQKMPCQCDSL